MSNSFGVDAECLILSASKRTLDSCVAELATRVPDAVKSVVNSKSFKRSEVFRDDLLSFLSFQSVYWRHIPAPSPSPNPHGVRDYLVLGYINGVQVWGISPPAGQSPQPSARRVLGFRTLAPVTAVQLLPDSPDSPNAPPSFRLAVVQRRSGCHAIDIFSASPSGEVVGVHVIQQPWPIVRLAASLSWTSPNSSDRANSVSTSPQSRSGESRSAASNANNCSRSQGGMANRNEFEKLNGRWCGTLVVATTLQIRIYDTTTFEIRFTISDFLSISLPPVWRWLSVDHTDRPPFSFGAGDGPAFGTHRSPTDEMSSARSSGPVFAVGSRWLIYQRVLSHPPHPCPRPVPSSGGSGVENLEGLQKWITPAKTAIQKMLASPHLSRLSGTAFPRPLDLFLDHTGASAAVFPVVESTSGPEADGASVQPSGGPIMIVDLITGAVLGQIRIDGPSRSSNGTAFVPAPRSNRNSQSSDKSERSGVERSGVERSGVEQVSFSEAHDGSWCLSHVDKGPSQESEVCSDDPVPTNKPPAMVFFNLDATGTTLVCAEWTGRLAWVCRLAGGAEPDQHVDLPPPPTSSSSRPLKHCVRGTPICQLKRGKTIGSIVDIGISSNITGESVIIVASSRGSGHCFSLPVGFHLSLTNQDPSHPDLTFPSTLSDSHLHTSPFIPSSRSSSVSSEDSEPSLPSHPPHSPAGNEAPRLTLRSHQPAFQHREGRLPRRRAVCRLDHVASSATRENHFYWKVAFTASPFFRPSSVPRKRRSWSLRGRMRRKEDHSSHYLPFLVASSDGVVDFCTAEFIGKGGKDNELPHSSFQPTAQGPVRLPSMMALSNEVCCVLGDDDAVPVPLATQTEETPMPPPTPSSESSWIPNSHLAFKAAFTASSLSTRDLEFTEASTSRDSQFQSSTSTPIWARFCEPLTASRRPLVYELRVLFIAERREGAEIGVEHVETFESSESLEQPIPQNSKILADRINSLLRSGSPIAFPLQQRLDSAAINTNMPRKCPKFVCAMDEALNTPFSSTPSTQQREMPADKVQQIESPSGYMASKTPLDEYVQYQY